MGRLGGSAWPLLLLLLLLLQAAAAAAADENSTESTTPSTAPLLQWSEGESRCHLPHGYGHDPEHRQALQWCAADPRCATAYHQRGYQNQTLFRFMLDRNMRGWSSRDALDELCQPADGGVEALRRRLWVLHMTLAELEHGMHCEPGHYPLIDADGGQMRCVCRSDYACGPAADSLVLGFTREATALGLLSVLILLLVTLYRMGQVLATNNALLRRTHSATERHSE